MAVAGYFNQRVRSLGRTSPALGYPSKRHARHSLNVICCSPAIYTSIRPVQVADRAYARNDKSSEVEPRGLEPLTPCLQSRCATNCAKAPGRLGRTVDRTPRGLWVASETDQATSERI